MGPATVNDWTRVATLSGGIAWATGGETQNFLLTPTIERTFVANDSTNTLPVGELFLGLQNTLSTQWQAQLGLALAISGNAKMQGDIWDDGSPEFNNHSYEYKIMHSHVAIKGKALMDNGNWFIPWISGSLGVGFNRAHDFVNTPFFFEAKPMNNFANHTKTAFTYTIGAGVQKVLNQNWQVGIGYEFADWGKNGLGRAFEQTLNSGLAMNHLYTNAVLLNLTFIA